MRARRTGTWEAAELALVAGVRRRVTLLVAGVGTLLVVLAGSVAYALLVHGQAAQVDGALRYAAGHGDPAHPDACIALFTQSPDGILVGSPGAPAGFPERTGLDGVARTGGTAVTTVERNGTVYRIRTQVRGTQVVQAVFDLRFQLADRRLLLWVLFGVELTGLAGSVLAGVVLGRRIVAPLGEALSRQRRFVVDASHELRTPIAQVQTRAQLIARRAARGQPAAEQRADLDRLVGTTRALGEVVDDVLSSAVPGERRFEPVDLTGCAEAAVATEADRATLGGVTVTLHRPPGPVLVPGVPAALRRVVRELLSNALAHTPAGGRVVVRVHPCGPVRAGRWSRWAELVVSDDGEGFDPAQARRLFDRFQRTGDGFGLGLALVREVVSAHGGSIEASGSPGGGARFAVRLPADIPSPVPSPPPSLVVGVDGTE